jgi:hypothetical protein
MEPSQTNELEHAIICPHCDEPILIEKLNCCIFRHGALKANGKQIEPHASKELCDFYIKKDMIYGCGKPFQIVQNADGEYTAVICDYI